MSDVKVRSVQAVSTLSLALAGVLLLPGCSTVSSFEAELEDISSKSRTFNLPSSVGGDMAWDELLIVCPYAEPKGDVHPVLAAAASEVDADSSDDLQWLIFRSNEDVSTLELSRIDFDFCSRSFSAEETFKPEAQWEMIEDDGASVIVPAE
ncbi:hypothetical protein [uncultured Microbacterium sp.]|uniref:hypothetical protein n=1 Tax=uncultured Microbacterium sp. TaxID=191216 RepID=UPI00260B2F84|nr:hypothetical protein [uncultured Microbacterium sp.]